MAKSVNSISDTANKQTEVFSNSIEVLTKLYNSLTSKELTPTLNLVNSNGEDITISLPNLFFLDSEIKRLDNNVNTLSGINNVAYIQNSDGTFNKVFSDKISSTPKPVQNLKVPVEFNRKNNWFFENFLSPLLYIDFDLTNLVDDNVNKLNVTRVIINTSNEVSLNYFNNQLKGRSDLNYDNLLLNLTQQGISFFLDNDTYTFTPSLLRYSGDFGVTSTFEIFNTELGRNVRYYRFANVTYTDNLSSSKNTQTLKVGDVLNLSKSTKYKVETIDVESKTLSLTLINGGEPIPVGDNVLSLDSKVFANKKISVNVGYDEKQVIFVSPITDLNVTTPTFSNGVCFDSNELRLVNSNNQSITLEEYYRSEVVDFGQQIMNLAKEKSIPTIFGEIPNPPNLAVVDFKVEQINTHIGNENLTEQIKRLLAEKTQTKNEIASKDVAIAKLVSQIQSTVPGNERTKLENGLSEITGLRNSLVSKYSSIITSLSLIYKENSVENIRPKYRVRGFWGYPQKVFNERTGLQEIVNFKVYYRYLTIDGTTPSNKQSTYTTADGTQLTGVFSNWNVYTTEPRKRFFDVNTNSFIWEEDNTSDPDVINSNQLDIPISVGEAVEIKVQSVSEAGYPTNPLVSDFSNSVVIPFPENLSNQIDLYTLLEESAREQERALIYQEISNYDFARHFLNNRFVDNQYYAHDSNEISYFDGSGFVRLSEVIGSLRNQIVDLNNKLQAQSNIDFRTGKLRVYIQGVNRNGDVTIYPVYNGGTVELQPPTYYSRVSKLSLNDMRGAIVRENYKLVIENEGDGVLRLNSLYPGLLSENLPDYSSGSLIFKNTLLPDETYLKNRRYDIAPMVYSGFNSPDSVNKYNNKFGWGLQQSPQVPGQFIYSRYKSIDGFKDLYYKDRNNLTGNDFYPLYLRPINLPNPFNSGGSKSALLWNGTYSPSVTSSLTQVSPANNPNGNGLINEFSVDLIHPEVSGNKKRYDVLVNDKRELPNLMEHAFGFNVEKGSVANWERQSPLTSINDAKTKFVKFGFLDSDRFLVGSNTTGLYFYPSPTSPEDIRVGNDFNSVRELQPNQKIEIPLRVEYRMTDYWNTSNNIKNSVSLGVVGGYNSKNVNRKDLNISYEKTLGFDITVKDMGVFSFDVKVNTVYGSDKNVITTNNNNIGNVGNTLNVNDTLVLPDSIKFIQI